MCYVCAMDWLDDHLAMMRNLQRRCNNHGDFTYAGMEDLLIQHGMRWKPQPLPEKWIGKVVCYPKACFDNSYRLAARSKGRLLYVEGVAVGIIPVHHAWCADSEGNVIDPTWGTFRDIGVGTIYHGVAIPVEVVKKLRTKHNCSALLDYVHGFPLLSKPFEFQQPLIQAKPVGTDEAALT